MALLGLRIDRLEHLHPPSLREAAQRALGGLLAAREGAGTWAIERRGETWWVLVPGVDVREALSLARGIVDVGRRLVVQDVGPIRRVSISCALAHSHHRSRPSLATCTAVVEEGLRVAAAGGGRRAVHSEIYAAFARAEGTSDLAASLADRAVAATTAPAQGLVEPAATAAQRELELPRTPAPAPAGPAGRGQGPLESRWSQLTRPRTGVPAEPATRPPAPPALVPASGSRPALDESELLHRRLTKLTRQLEEAEAEIASLRAQTSRESGGLSSIYREVQGLAEDAPLVEVKRSLMASIFEANVELRELVRPRD